MGITFKGDHSRDDRRKLVRVVIPTVGEPLQIVIGSNPIYWRTVSLHYDVALKRPVPCRTMDCPYCPAPTRETTYVPCLLAKGAGTGARFNPRIVPVTDGWSEILDADHRTNVFRVTRQAKTSSCRWSIQTSLSTLGLTPYEGQVIESSLYRMWGLKQEN